MSRKYLGDTIDIHAGGRDLTFPHHENEIAQSEAANGKKYANYWMHNGYITLDDSKMSKSKGNFFTVRDILNDYDGEVIRFFLLSGHYRNPLGFSGELMEQSKNALDRIYNAKRTLEHLSEKGADELTDAERESLAGLGKYREKFIASMDDDLNTADAIAAIYELISEVNNVAAAGASKRYAGQALAELLELANVLGLLERAGAEGEGGADENDADLQRLIDERGRARENKDWAEADRIRDELAARGVVLKDTPQGVQVVRVN
jgi:cysteinyl-tRNA synthetase